MNGLEYADLSNELAEYADAFENVVLGEPLLTSDEDFKAVAKAITDATKEYDDGETASALWATEPRQSPTRYTQRCSRY